MGLVRPLIFLRASAGMLAAWVAVWLAGCAAFEVHKEPVNQPLAGNVAATLAAGRNNTSGSDDLMVGLAFSGGGTARGGFLLWRPLRDRAHAIARPRRSAFAARSRELRLRVSGGSVLTAYYGLKKRAALADFRERFLLRNAEEPLTTEVSPLSVVRAVAGGVNDSSKFARWLDDNLFEGATFSDMSRTRGPGIWINASDIYNRTTFIFGSAAFTALCSDLASYPLADAVAASAAVPVASRSGRHQVLSSEMHGQAPGDGSSARSATRNAAPMLKAFADALHRYHNGSNELRQAARRRIWLTTSVFPASPSYACCPTRPTVPCTRQEVVKLRRRHHHHR